MQPLCLRRISVVRVYVYMYVVYMYLWMSPHVNSGTPFLVLRCSGEPFQAWAMWLSPHSEKPVGSEVGGLDPRPWIGSPVGNQACIVPRLLWDLLLLKLPHPELRQQMLTEYLHLPKVCAKPPKYGVWATSPLSCNILLFEVISSVLSFVLLKRWRTCGEPPVENLWMVNEDRPQCNVPRKTIKACPGRGQGPSL